MANYAPSALLNAQAKLIQKFQSGEMRFTDPIVYKLFLETKDIMFPNYNELRTDESRAISTYYKARTSRAAGSARSHNHSGARSDSGLLSPTWTTYDDKFLINLKQGGHNVFSYEEMLTHELENAMINEVNSLNTAATAYLFANRTGVNGAVLGDGNVFDSAKDVFEITADSNSDWGVFNNRAGSLTEMVMNINNWGRDYDVVCDSVSYAKFKAQASQGAGNDKNLEFNFGGQRFIHAVGLYSLAIALDASYTNGFWMAVPKGTIACLPWIPIQNRQGVDTKIQRYSSIINPIDNQLYALHEYETAGSGAGVGGQLQDELQQKEISIDVAFESAPDSTADATSMFAFAIEPGS